MARMQDEESKSQEQVRTRARDQAEAPRAAEGEEEGPVVEAMEGSRVLETWDDLLDLAPGEEVLVPLSSPVAEAVWVWAKTMEDDNPAGRLSRGVRALLLALHVSDYRGMLEATRTILLSLASILP